MRQTGECVSSPPLPSRTCTELIYDFFSYVPKYEKKIFKEKMECECEVEIAVSVGVTFASTVCLCASCAAVICFVSCLSDTVESFFKR